MGRILNAKELLLVSGGNSGNSGDDDDEEDDDDTVVTTARQWVVYSFGSSAGHYGGGGPSVGDTGEGDFPGDDDYEDLIVVTDQQDKAEDQINTIIHMINMLEAIQDGFQLQILDDLGNFIPLDLPESLVQELLDGLRDAAQVLDASLSAGEAIQLAIDGHFHDALSTAIQTIIETAGAAALTAIFAAIGTATTATPLGGAFFGAAGFIAGIEYNNLSANDREFVADALTDLLIAMINALEAGLDLVVLFGAAAADIAEQIGLTLTQDADTIVDVIDQLADPLGPIGDALDPNDPTEPPKPPQWWDFLNETPAPGTEYR